MRRIINIAISLFLLFHFGHTHGQHVIDTFLIKDLTENSLQAEFDYKLHEDSEYYYYLVEREMFNVQKRLVGSEIVTFITKRDCKFEVQGNIIEDTIMPSKVDTSGGGYILLLKFTKDFELVDYTVLKNIEYEISDAIQDFRVSNGKIYLVSWTDQDYPVMINDQEFATGLDTTEKGKSMNCLIVLDQDLEAQFVRYFPQVNLKGVIPNNNEEVILGCQIPNNNLNKVVIGKATINNNLFDGHSDSTSFENVVLCNYNFIKDSTSWWELISNDLGVRLSEVEEGPDNKVYLHLTAASPYVYIGLEGYETDSVEVFGAAVPWSSEKRDHLMMIFDKNNGGYLSSLTIPEGIFDNWYNIVIDTEGNIYISAIFYGDSITIRDTVFENNFMINNPSEFSFRDGLLKFSPDGDLLWGYYSAGEFAYNFIYGLTLSGSGLYVMSGMGGGNIIVGDSVLTGGKEKMRHFLYRISVDGKNKELLYHANAPIDAIVDVKEINEDTLVMIPYIGPQDWIYDYQWNPEEGLGILKVDFSEKIVANNTVTISQPTKVKIYPNPISAGSYLTLEFKDNVNVKSVVIYDCNGRPVAKSDHISTESMKVKIPEVPPGQYYIKCTLEDGIFFKPLIVQ